MSKFREKLQMGNLLSSSLGVFIALAGWGVVSGLGDQLTDVIDSAMPVVQFGYRDKKTGEYQPAIQDTYRDSEKACWTLYIEKLSYAKVLKYDFWVEGGDTGARIGTTAYLVDDQNRPIDASDTVNGKLLSHPVGEQWHRRYCFDNADRVPDFRTMTVFGRAQHQRLPGLWVTETQVPSFSIGPIAGLR